MKSSLAESAYDDVISVVDDLFDKCNPSTATPMKEVCGPQGRLLC